MKKLLKAIVCILIAGLTIFGFVAKYDTLGILPFTPVDYPKFPDPMEHSNFHDTVKESGSNALGGTPAYVYKNKFGRNVFMRTERDELFANLYHSHNGITTEQCKICNPPPNRVACLYSVSPGITTHLDFFNLSNSPKPFYFVLKNAGIPSDLSTSVTFIFETQDGYQYHILGGATSGHAMLRAVVAPDGTKLTAEQISDLTGKIALVYLGITAVLSVFLVFLLMLNRHLHKDVPSTHSPMRRQKIIAIVACVLLLLGHGIRFAANVDYNGCFVNTALPHYFNIPYIQDYYPAIKNGVLVNHFGKIAALSQLQSKNNTVLIPLGTYTPMPRTHFSALSVSRGTSVTQLYGILGMPDDFKGTSGNKRLTYLLPSGYTYEFSTKYRSGIGVSTVADWTITAPDGTQLDAAAFQWQVRLIYLGIAAGLGILAAALAIPNHIRKRKSTV